ncbi:MAG: FecR domain-containing protein [Candidatus Riflebacteria bacterium]|nr:FecR domain-containing protein [Candidatus Riflebacteria bacterium]
MTRYPVLSVPVLLVAILFAATCSVADVPPAQGQGRDNPARDSSRTTAATPTAQPAREGRAPSLPPVSPRRFSEVYPVGMAVFLPGSGSVLLPDRPDRPLVPDRETLLPTGSIVRTGPTEEARVRLGERSLLRIGPDSEVVFRALHLEISRGTVFLRHGETLLPLPVRSGRSLVLLDRGAAADLEAQEDGLLVTPQAGSVRRPGQPRAFGPGERFFCRGDTLVEDAPPARTAPALAAAGPQTPDRVLWPELVDALETALAEAATGDWPAPGPDSTGPAPAVEPAAPPRPMGILRHHTLTGSGSEEIGP